jgi:hypothetical protein
MESYYVPIAVPMLARERKEDYASMMLSVENGISARHHQPRLEGVTATIHKAMGAFECYDNINIIQVEI